MKVILALFIVSSLIWSVICYLGIGMFQTFEAYASDLSSMNMRELVGELPTVFGLAFPFFAAAILLSYFIRRSA